MIYSSQLHSAASLKEREYLEGWQRARAELDNFRKQATRQREHDVQSVKRDVAEYLLVLVDNMRALTEHVPQDLQNDSWAKGVMHVARQFDQAMRNYGITMIDADKKTFDPAIHEAVEQVKRKGMKSGTIIEVLQAGYKMGDMVIRPARVRVAK